MNKSFIKMAAMLFILGAAGFSYGETKTASTSLKLLTEGKYSAQVKALVCSGCGPFIEQTMQTTQGIESAKVDSSKKLLSFKIKKGSSLKVADLQKKLDLSAKQMGMGADYSLTDLKSVK